MKTPQILSKDELERQKLALEIRELQRRWWQRPVYLSVLLPIVLASLTLLAGILSGYFNRERRQLTHDIEALKAEKTALIERANELLAANRETEKWLVQARRLRFERAKEVFDALASQINSTPTPTPTPSSN